ncbi:hypothetical protein [Dysgonomonas sp. ZJ279]|uniref:hypothetical protein n=1 Tax=Dysgonomonas sp. ZJ279 TaxID=2709796 RepID=UPI0013EC6F67|nr:hypothetical protein [Dysgonomonas sp. ZJ279]
MAKKERELPEVLEYDFIITDESVNRYKWRLLVAGIDLSGFIKNPVCCVQHAMDMIPVGKWKNIRVEGQELKGTVEFDPNDPDAVKLFWKYKDGFMNAVSLHVLPIEVSSNTKLLLPDQKYPTLIKSELLEISIVTVPGQKNAVKLSTPEGTEYKLNLLTQNKEMAQEKTVEEIQKELDDQRKLTAENLVDRHVDRGVVEDGEVASLKKLAFVDYTEVKTMLEARKTPSPSSETNSAEVNADALIKLHFDRAAITEAEKSIYRPAAILDYDGTKKVLEMKTGKDGVQSFVVGLSNGNNNSGGNADERANWTYYDYFRKDQHALSMMEKNEPDKFKKLEADFQASSAPNGVFV